MRLGRRPKDAPPGEATRALNVSRFPARLLDALNVEAARRGVAAAELVRIAVARELGLPAEIVPGDRPCGDAEEGSPCPSG